MLLRLFAVAFLFIGFTPSGAVIAQEPFSAARPNVVLVQQRAPIIVEEVAPRQPRQLRYVPRVYGWSAQAYGPPAPRRTDCGVFRYWNGERCADARFEPPAQ